MQCPPTTSLFFSAIELTNCFNSLEGHSMNLKAYTGAQIVWYHVKGTYYSTLNIFFCLIPKVQLCHQVVYIHSLKDHSQFHRLKYHLYSPKLISLAQTWLSKIQTQIHITSCLPHLSIWVYSRYLKRNMFNTKFLVLIPKLTHPLCLLP